MAAASEGHVECLRLLLEHSPQAKVAAEPHGRNALPECMRPFTAMPPASSSSLPTSPQSRWQQLMRLDGTRSCALPPVAPPPASSSCWSTVPSPNIQLAAVSAHWQGLGALSVAARNGHVDCLQLLRARSPPQQQLDRALQEAAQQLAVPTAYLRSWSSAEQRSLGLKQCVELLLASGAMLPAQASEGAIAAIRPIIQELAARARVPDMANQAVVGLALAAAAGRKRRASGGDAAAGPSSRPCS